MKKKLFILLTILSLIFANSSFSFENKKAIATNTDFDCTYSSGSIYGQSQIITYTEQEAISANVPSGYSGSVLKVVSTSNATNKGLTLNFSSFKIPSGVVESITFRVYVSIDSKIGDGYPEIRIPKRGNSTAWTLRYSIENHTGQWFDVIVDKDAYFEENQGSINDISKNGFLDEFELALRQQNASDFYIDSIKVNYIANDGVAPIITYNGEDHVSIAQGQVLNFDVSAMASYNQPLDVEYVWEDESKLDENGNPLCGEHTLTFTATDFFGNVAEHSITVTVTEPDLLAPEMTIPTTEIYVKTGTTPLINVKAIDNKDGEIEIVREWSKNALDKTGKLTEGTHTLTLTASDLSGNTTVKVITFYVSANGDSEENIVDEEILCPKESEPESESESESIAQTESAKESESIKQSESEKVSASESEKESESVKQSESEKVSVSESKKESESIKQSESKKESESKKTSESKKESNKQSSKDSSKDSQSSSAVSSGCVGAISIIPFISLLTLAGAISLIKKKK